MNSPNSITKSEIKMNNLEIIEGLMLKLADETIDVTSLVKRIGFKNYKKFAKAMDESFKLTRKQ